MKAMETEKFKKFGSSFFLLLFGVGFGLPFLISLIRELVRGDFRWGVRFVFELDGKKITMYTLISNRAVNLKSGIGAEAISKADTFVKLLMAAKSRAEGGV